MSDQGGAGAAVMSHPQGDARHGEQCPFCMSGVLAAATVCSACGAQKSLRAAQFPIARLFLWCGLFGTIWVVGGAATVLPWGERDSGFRDTSEQQCVLHVMLEHRRRPGVTIPGEPGRISIADKACDAVPKLREAVESALAGERRSHPAVTYRVYDSPRTIPKSRPATTGERAFFATQRLLISAGGLLLLLFGTRLGNRLWRWGFGKATDPIWVR
jgi:hypothetical protein